MKINNFGSEPCLTYLYSISGVKLIRHYTILDCQSHAGGDGVLHA